MDTFTHGFFGAAAGAALFSPEHQRRAAAVAAVLAALPDADLLLRPLLAHRAESHAFFYLALAAPLCAWGVQKIIGGASAYARCLLLTVIALFSHPFLDILNSYGTASLLPFSPRLLALDVFPIIDPLFSLPLCAAALALSFPFVRWRRAQRALAVAALVWGLLYCACAFNLRDRALAAAPAPEKAAAPADGANLLCRANPLTGTTFVWRCVKKEGTQALVSYVDALRGRVLRQETAVSADDPQIREVAAAAPLEDFIRRSCGLWTAAREDNGRTLKFRDLRYGTLRDPHTPFFTLRVELSPAGEITGCFREFPRLNSGNTRQEFAAIWRVIWNGQ